MGMGIVLVFPMSAPTKLVQDGAPGCERACTLMKTTE